MTAVGAAVALAGIATDQPGTIAIGVTAAAALAGIAVVSRRARVTVTGEHVRVELGPYRKTVPLADIAAVEALDVEPLRYGGWGVRWIPRGTAIVLRRGEGLLITRRSGRRLVVTVDDAAAAARAIEQARSA